MKRIGGLSKRGLFLFLLLSVVSYLVLFGYDPYPSVSTFYPPSDIKTSGKIIEPVFEVFDEDGCGPGTSQVQSVVLDQLSFPFIIAYGARIGPWNSAWGTRYWVTVHSVRSPETVNCNTSITLKACPLNIDVISACFEESLKLSGVPGSAKYISETEDALAAGTRRLMTDIRVYYDF